MFNFVKSKILNFVQNSPKATASISVVILACLVLVALTATGHLDTATAVEYIRQLLTVLN